MNGKPKKPPVVLLALAVAVAVVMAALAFFIIADNASEVPRDARDRYEERRANLQPNPQPTLRP